LAARTAAALVLTKRKTANMAPYLDIGGCWREHEMERVTTEQGLRGIGSSWSSGGVWRCGAMAALGVEQLSRSGSSKNRRERVSWGIEWR
jgi:hypothetical protein